MSKALLDVLNGSSEIVGPLREMVSKAVRAASYKTCHRACKLGLWDENLANSLDKSLEDPNRP